MVSFICDTCQSVLRKPKVKQHLLQCYTSSMSCIDCNTAFSDDTIHQHISCISEVEKYHGQGQGHSGKQKQQQKHTQTKQHDDTYTSSTSTSTSSPSSESYDPSNNHSIDESKRQRQKRKKHKQSSHDTCTDTDTAMIVNNSMNDTSSATATALESIVHEALQSTHNKAMTLKRLYKTIRKQQSLSTSSYSKSDILDAVTQQFIENDEYIEIRWKKSKKSKA